MTSECKQDAMESTSLLIQFRVKILLTIFLMKTAFKDNVSKKQEVPPPNMESVANFLERLVQHLILEKQKLCKTRVRVPGDSQAVLTSTAVLHGHPGSHCSILHPQGPSGLRSPAPPHLPGDEAPHGKWQNQNMNTLS